MSRANVAAQQRNLSLTEELERLEQSITLTLQEIDHNFSKAHRIVTSSILPIVEQYASHSKDVWEGSKFWKQFFESSANVSLSGYEEQPSSQDILEETVTDDSNATATHTTLDESQSYETPTAQHISTSSIADLDLSNLSVSPSHSTPRPSKKQAQPAFADYPSPYEALRQEVNNATNLETTAMEQTDIAPETPGRNAMQDVAMTPQASPELPRLPASTARPSTTRKKTDPLLHRVLDKTYRIQATPMTNNRFRPTTTTTPATVTQTRHALLDSTLSSSPEVAPPQLHAEIFNSPERRRRVSGASPRKPGPGSIKQQLQQQRMPGVSVLTPARKNPTKYQPPTRTPGVWDSDDEDDFDEATGMPYGASPPKTMQFHVPQSRLLKTPAKEASKRIVDDILKTAGVSHPGQDNTEDDLDLDLDLDLDVDIDIDIDLDADLDHDINGHGRGHGQGLRSGHGFAEENSPSIVRRAPGLEDETF